MQKVLLYPQKTMLCVNKLKYIFWSTVVLKIITLNEVYILTTENSI